MFRDGKWYILAPGLDGAGPFEVEITEAEHKRIEATRAPSRQFTVDPRAGRQPGERCKSRNSLKGYTMSGFIILTQKEVAENVVVVSAVVKKYYNLLNRVPDEVILDLGSREFFMEDANQCLAGWAMRSGLERLGKERTFAEGAVSTCVRLYGGTYNDWYSLFLGVTQPDGLRDVELAFALRLDDAASK